MNKKILSFFLLAAAGIFFILPLWAQDTALPKGDLTSALQDFSKLDPGQKNLILSSTGVPNPNSFDLSGLLASLIFGAIGFIAFVYGKKNAAWKPMVIGIVLMGYPYCVSGPLMLYGIGIGLTALLYFWRD